VCRSHHLVHPPPPPFVRAKIIVHASERVFRIVLYKIICVLYRCPRSRRRTGYIFLYASARVHVIWYIIYLFLLCVCVSVSLSFSLGHSMSALCLSDYLAHSLSPPPLVYVVAASKILLYFSLNKRFFSIPDDDDDGAESYKNLVD